MNVANNGWSVDCRWEEHPNTVQDSVAQCEQRLTALKRLQQLMAELQPLLDTLPDQRPVVAAEVGIGKTAVVVKPITVTVPPEPTPPPQPKPHRRRVIPLTLGDDMTDDVTLSVAARLGRFFQRQGGKAARAREAAKALKVKEQLVSKAFTRGLGRQFKRVAPGLYTAM